MEIPSLPTTFSCLAEIPGQWRGLFVAGTFERRIAARLWEMGIPYFLPLARRDSRHSELHPLFAGYLFFAADDVDLSEIRVAARRSGSALCQVVDDNRRLLRKELINISMALAVNPSVGVTRSFTAGQRVRITTGAMEGTEGLVQSSDFRHGVRRVTLSTHAEVFHSRRAVQMFLPCTLLGGAATLEVDADDLEVIS